jgi:hypothetical protein
VAAVFFKKSTEYPHFAVCFKWCECLKNILNCQNLFSVQSCIEKLLQERGKTGTGLFTDTVHSTVHGHCSSQGLFSWWPALLTASCVSTGTVHMYYSLRVLFTDFSCSIQPTCQWSD